MTRFPLLFCLGVVWVTDAGAQVAARAVRTPPPTEPPLQSVSLAELPTGLDRIDIVLLMGQSNMKGRGIMPEVPANDPAIVAMHLKNDQWYRARHPLHLTGSPETFAGHDNAGVGPGLAFAHSLKANSPRARVALVPCAVGGSPLNLWVKGGKLYEECVRRARKAMMDADGVPVRIRAAIWLQGEADAKPGWVETYSERLGRMITDLRGDLGIRDLPFVAVTIGEMKDDEGASHRAAVNEGLLALNEEEHSACVDARDLKGHIGDAVHYDTASQEEMGRRLAKKLFELESK